MNEHERYLRLALELAARGRGRVEPNPVVGCVIVRDGEIVGRGYHQCYGEAHAEVHALRAAGERARGATAYVTLEPCSRLDKKTPPCTDALIRAGVRHVVMGARDATQQGIDKLRQAQIEVTTDVLEAECRDLNRPFFKLTATGAAYLIAKWAMSLDGRIATSTGDSRWISSPEARALAHHWRDQVDVLAVGVGTIVADDPLLTTRLPEGRTPIRLVLDSAARTPRTAALLRSVDQGPVWIAVGDAAPVATIQVLREAGAEAIVLPTLNGRIDLRAWLVELGRRRLTNVMLEGGGTVLGAAFDAGLVDEVRVFITPTIIGGAGARSPVLGRGSEKVDAAPRLHALASRQVGPDLLITGYVTPAASL